MKKIYNLLLTSLLIATPFLSFANEIEQHEINTEQTGESRWGKTILHGVSALLSGYAAVQSARPLYNTTNLPTGDVVFVCLLSAIFATNTLSSGIALYDLHKKRTLPVSSVKYSEPALGTPPLEK